MQISVTGTRNGMTPQQREAFARIVADLRPDGLRHGACRGADADAVDVAYEVQPVPCIIVAHPGRSANDDPKGGPRPDRDDASIMQSDHVEPEKTHFARNRDLVDACDLLVAFPPCKPMPDSGGTAYTVGYARKVGKLLAIIWPDGSETREPGRG